VLERRAAKAEMDEETPDEIWWFPENKKEFLVEEEAEQEAEEEDKWVLLWSEGDELLW